jgi:aldehyde dehydrogenase (NAD+)
MDFKQLDRQFINGEWVEGSGRKEIIDSNPYDGSPLAKFVIATINDVDAAYSSAKRSQRTWAAVSAYDKRGIFENAARFLEENTDAVAQIIVQETGGTYLKAHFEINLALDTLKEASTLSLRIEGKILPSPTTGKDNFLYRIPVGIVGVISPFNFPFFLSMKSVAPALATGNGVVLKPHEDTPITGGTLIAKIFQEAGLPSGLLNVIVTDISTIGDAFIEHPVPRIIAFTGSAGVGRHIAEVASRHLKKPLLELGGNSALIVLDDADVDYAVEAAVFSRFTHQGQICMSANRILVHESVMEEFLERFVDKVSSLLVGDPSDPSTVLGPLMNRRQAATLERLVADSVAQGARAVLEGGARGNLFYPVVLTDVTPDMAVARCELFGPVVCVIPFSTDAEAAALANDSEFGLSGAVHSRNIDRATQLAHHVETGMIHVNDATIHDEPIIAFGGEKNSGIGRLNGQWSIEEFTSVKWISVNRKRQNFPY